MKQNRIIKFFNERTFKFAVELSRSIVYNHNIRAQLDDGSTILIEMHLYDLDELKYKTIHSWARAYGEELKTNEVYSTQPPVICVTFANGPLDEGENQKIHKCCKMLANWLAVIT